MGLAVAVYVWGGKPKPKRKNRKVGNDQKNQRILLDLLFSSPPKTLASILDIGSRC